MTPRRVSAVAVAVAAASASLVGCSSGEPLSSPTTIATSTTRPVALPPRDIGALVKLVAPLLPSDDDIQRVYLDLGAPHGTVLFSIYVRPRKSRSADGYARRLAPLAKALIPVLFARYPGVRAIDLCQELPNDAADQDPQSPVTRVLIFRDAAAAIDWSTFDLSTVRRLARGRRPQIQLQVTADVAGTPSFLAAEP